MIITIVYHGRNFYFLSYRASLSVKVKICLLMTISHRWHSTIRQTYRIRRTVSLRSIVIGAHQATHIAIISRCFYDFKYRSDRRFELLLINLVIVFVVMLRWRKHYLIMLEGLVVEVNQRQVWCIETIE